MTVSDHDIPCLQPLDWTCDLLFTLESRLGKAMSQLMLLPQNTAAQAAGEVWLRDAVVQPVQTYHMVESHTMQCCLIDLRLSVKPCILLQRRWVARCGCGTRWCGPSGRTTGWPPRATCFPASSASSRRTWPGGQARTLLRCAPRGR